MRAAISLLVLLFSMCGAANVPTQLDIVSADLKEVRDIAAELKGALRYTQDKLKTMEGENSAVKERLGVSEKELAVFKTRLSTSEAEVMSLKRETAAQSADLRSVVERLAVTNSELQNLEKMPETTKVAFSAECNTLSASSSERYVICTKIITNVGQAYSPTTGFFTATVRGVYYFRFTVMDKLNNKYMYISMYKNGVQLMKLYEYDIDNHPSYLSSGLTLVLEVGDLVNLRLPSGGLTNLYGDNIFTGFLLFPL